MWLSAGLDLSKCPPEIGQRLLGTHRTLIAVSLWSNVEAESDERSIWGFIFFFGALGLNEATACVTQHLLIWICAKSERLGGELVQPAMVIDKFSFKNCPHVPLGKPRSF